MSKDAPCELHPGETFTSTSGQAICRKCRSEQSRRVSKSYWRDVHSRRREKAQARLEKHGERLAAVKATPVAEKQSSQNAADSLSFTLSSEALAFVRRCNEARAFEAAFLERQRSEARAWNARMKQELAANG